MSYERGSEGLPAFVPCTDALPLEPMVLVSDGAIAEWGRPLRPKLRVTEGPSGGGTVNPTTTDFWLQIDDTSSVQVFLDKPDDCEPSDVWVKNATAFPFDVMPSFSDPGTTIDGGPSVTLNANDTVHLTYYAATNTWYII